MVDRCNQLIITKASVHNILPSLFLSASSATSLPKVLKKATGHIKAIRHIYSFHCFILFSTHSPLLYSFNNKELDVNTICKNLLYQFINYKHYNQFYQDTNIPTAIILPSQILIDFCNYMFILICFYQGDIASLYSFLKWPLYTIIWIANYILLNFFSIMGNILLICYILF